jgi:ribosomal protein L11 methyltransferase
MALVELKVEIPPELVQQVDDTFLETGLENWSVLEDVVVRRAWLIGILAAHDVPLQTWASVEQLLRQRGVEIRAQPVVRSLADEDWRNSYKLHFHPWQFGRLHWVPIWEKDAYTLPPNAAALWLDPGLAFGTGNHETTRMCVERMVAWAEEKGTEGRVVDAGCGSGILALSAALLGYPEVFAFDNDPEAVRISEENAALNQMVGRVRFSTADLASGLAGEHGRTNLLLANIQSDVLIRNARDLVGAVAPGGALVLSGILAAENADVRNVFETHAPKWTVNARTVGEWSDILLVRSADQQSHG